MYSGKEMIIQSGKVMANMQEKIIDYILEKRPINKYLVLSENGNIIASEEYENKKIYYENLHKKNLHREYFDKILIDEFMKLTEYISEEFINDFYELEKLGIKKVVY